MELFIINYPKEQILGRKKIYINKGTFNKKDPETRGTAFINLFPLVVRF